MPDRRDRYSRLELPREPRRSGRNDRSLPRGREAGHDPVGTAFIVILIALLIASVLIGDRLGQAARAMPVGSLQTAAKVAVFLPEWLNGALRIDRLGEGIRSLVMGPFDPSIEKPSEPTDPSGPAVVEEPTSSVEPTAPGETPPAEPSQEPGTPTVAEYRAMDPSPENPLSLIIHGDSMTEAFGKYLKADLLATGEVDAVHDFQFSSGLARPDFYDWPTHLKKTMAKDPDVVIMMFGANDGQNVKPADRVLEFGSPDWRAWYAERVGEAMDIVAQKGRRVYWVSLPNARDAAYAKRMRTLNEVYASEAEKHPTITYVDTWKLFAGADGSYQAYLPDSEGTVRLMRQEDGIHLSIFGAHRLSDHMEELLAKDVGVTFPE